MKRTVGFGLVVLILCANLVWSQIRARVDLVVVPVSVKDSKGKLVSGLTKENFIVLEDGVSQTISNFGNDIQPLSAAIVVDDGMSLSALQRLTPRFGASLFVALTAAFAPDDEMIAFRYDRSVFKLSEFTSDPQKIQDSLKVIAAIAAARPPEPIPVFGDRRPGWLQSVFAILQFGHKPTRTGRVLHDAIYDAAVVLQDRSADRRKLVFVISDGQISGASQSHTLEQTTDLLLKNDIQVYGVSPEAPAFGSFGALSSFGRATGGEVFDGTSTTSMENAFSGITDQARNQYVLGYVSSNVARGHEVFRSIVVKTRDPNLKVTHRKGYLQYPSQ